MVSSYFIGKIKINNQAEYQKYLDGFDEIFIKFNGKVIAVDDSPEILEGADFEARVVIIRFPSEEDLKNWYFSKEYQKLAIFRKNASESEIMVVMGRE